MLGDAIILLASTSVAPGPQAPGATAASMWRREPTRREPCSLGTEYQTQPTPSPSGPFFALVSTPEEIIFCPANLGHPMLLHILEGPKEETERKEKKIATTARCKCSQPAPFQGMRSVCFMLYLSLRSCQSPVQTRLRFFRWAVPESSLLGVSLPRSLLVNRQSVQVALERLLLPLVLHQPVLGLVQEPVGRHVGAVAHACHRRYILGQLGLAQVVRGEVDAGGRDRQGGATGQGLNRRRLDGQGLRDLLDPRGVAEAEHAAVASAQGLGAGRGRILVVHHALHGAGAGVLLLDLGQEVLERLEHAADLLLRDPSDCVDLSKGAWRMSLATSDEDAAGDHRFLALALHLAVLVRQLEDVRGARRHVDTRLHDVDDAVDGPVALLQVVVELVRLRLAVDTVDLPGVLSTGAADAPRVHLRPQTLVVGQGVGRFSDTRRVVTVLVVVGKGTPLGPGVDDAVAEDDAARATHHVAAGELLDQVRGIFLAVLAYQTVGQVLSVVYRSAAAAAAKVGLGRHFGLLTGRRVRRGEVFEFAEC